jgi:glucokinase
MEKLAVGVDVGGSHISCALYNINNRHFANNDRIRMNVNSLAHGNDILNTWAEAIRKTIVPVGFENIMGIGCAMPGPFDYKKGISHIRGLHKFDDLYGVNIGTELRSILKIPASIPVRFLNDAACFAVGESFREPAHHYPKLLAITLGTGFGTTFINHHRPVSGQQGVPNDGFLYHIPVGNATADDHFSTRWFVNQWKALTGEDITGVKELAKLASSNQQALSLFTIFGRKLGNFLSPWLREFGAGCLVAGGNIAAAYPLFGPELEQTLADAGCPLPVIISENPEDASITGSAMLCDNQFYKSLLSI